MRTCIGCRRPSPVGRLVRLALSPAGTVVVDRLAPGRGAWLCRGAGPDRPDPGCLDLAVRKSAFTRAFRAQVGNEGIQPLREMVEEHARIEGAPSSGAHEGRD